MAFSLSIPGVFTLRSSLSSPATSSPADHFASCYAGKTEILQGMPSFSYHPDCKPAASVAIYLPTIQFLSKVSCPEFFTPPLLPSQDLAHELILLPSLSQFPPLHRIFPVSVHKCSKSSHLLKKKKIKPKPLFPAGAASPSSSSNGLLPGAVRVL